VARDAATLDAYAGRLVIEFASRRVAARALQLPAADTGRL